MKRLVRGLGSSRQGARQGFALALTLVLGKAECISAQGAAALIGSMLEAGGAAKVRGRGLCYGSLLGCEHLAQPARLLPGGSCTCSTLLAAQSMRQTILPRSSRRRPALAPRAQGGEQRDMLLGQIFGYGAVVRSGKAVDAETAREMVEALARAGAKKSFLQEAAGGGVAGRRGKARRAVLACAACWHGCWGALPTGKAVVCAGWLPSVPARRTTHATSLGWSRTQCVFTLCRCSRCDAGAAGAGGR